MDDLFISESATGNAGGAISPNAPLAARFRPRTLEEYIGQEHLLAPGKPLRRLIEADRLASLILFGPPGVGKTSLAEFMAALVSARLVLCNDSGAMHVASALGVPTLAVFGSTEPRLTGPMGERSRVLRHHVPCSPCFLRECPIDFACMKSITPETAIGVAETMLR